MRKLLKEGATFGKSSKHRTADASAPPSLSTAGESAGDKPETPEPSEPSEDAEKTEKSN